MAEWNKLPHVERHPRAEFGEKSRFAVIRLRMADLPISALALPARSHRAWFEADLVQCEADARHLLRQPPSRAG
jgi:hypothetical protein